MYAKHKDKDLERVDSSLEPLKYILILPSLTINSLHFGY